MGNGTQTCLIPVTKCTGQKLDWKRTKWKMIWEGLSFAFIGQEMNIDLTWHFEVTSQHECQNLRVMQEPSSSSELLRTGDLNLPDPLIPVIYTPVTFLDQHITLCARLSWFLPNCPLCQQYICSSVYLENHCSGSSLVVQQLRIRLAMQRMQVQFLVGELRFHVIRSGQKTNKTKKNQEK